MCTTIAYEMTSGRWPKLNDVPRKYRSSREIVHCVEKPMLGHRSEAGGGQHNETKQSA